MWTTPTIVREQYLGVGTDVAPDTLLTPLIEKAERYVKEHISVELVKIETKKVDEHVFLLYFIPVADSNFDQIVDSDDITAYFLHGVEWRSTEVVYFFPELGIIITADDPESIFADYSMWVRGIPDWKKVEEAVSLLTAHYYFRREVLLLPETVRFGVLSLRKTVRWTEDSWKQFLRMLNILRSPVEARRKRRVLPEVAVDDFSYSSGDKTVEATETTATQKDILSKEKSLPKTIVLKGTNADTTQTLNVRVSGKHAEGESNLCEITIPAGESKEETFELKSFKKKVPTGLHIDEYVLYGWYSAAATSASTISYKLEGLILTLREGLCKE